MVPYIHNLPIELLAQILLHSLTSGPWRKSYKLFGMKSITRLRSVCVRWNETMLGEPAFWTHINEDDVLEASSSVENKIRRSGVLPLTIGYRNWGDVSDFGQESPEYPEFFKFIELISRHTNRWRSLFIYAFDSELWEVLECLKEQDFPELQNLEIRRGSITESGHNWILDGTPKLQRLALDGCLIPSSCSPLRSLAALEVRGAISSLDELVEMIQQSENLEELVLSDIQFDDHNAEFQMDIGWPDESNPTSLPKLKKIQITDFRSNPASETRPPEEDWEEVLVMLAAVVRLSGLPIRLRFGWQPPRILVDALSLFPSAKEFELVSSETPLGDVLQLFSLLSHPLRQGEGKARWVCPGLARFCLNGQRSEQELAVLRNEADNLTRSRKDFNKEESQRHGGSDTDGCLEDMMVPDRSETHRSPPDAYDGAQLSSALTTSYANPCPPGSAGINNLPTEILAEILLFCVITIDNTTWDDSRFGLVCLRTLRSVCARWDETILGNHNFWTHIDIRVESPLAVRLKLLRSGALPLTIRYFNTEGIGDSGGGNPEFSAIMDLVGSHIHRWKSISFWALDHELEQMTHYLQTSPLPEMEYLKMGRNSVSPDLLAWTLASAPKLRTVVLDGQALPKNCSEFRSLVHIEIEGAIGNLGLLVEAIQASHSLETLSLTDTIFDDNDVAEQQRIGWPDESRPPVLPRLRDIFISGFQSPAAIGCVLRSIRAPNVTALRIFETRSRVYQAGSEVTRAITTYHGDESILVSMLRNTSPLAKLELRCYGEVMDLELDDRDRDLVCRLELSVLHMGTNWMQSAEMIAAVVRDVDVTLRLKFGKPPHATIASFLVTFSMTKELDFTSPDMPVEYVLRYVSVLSRPYNVGGNANMWICPQLAELRLPGEKPEADIMAIAEACLVAKHARRDFNNRSTREGDGGRLDKVSAEFRVTVGGLEFEHE
ncbi:hypothetical protein FRC00_002551 [Tulasnella sp. 408]|nr:hypothetical protein FRC00_002551 [Tulasnella sp. 408]